MNLTKLCISEPVQGSLKGACNICGGETTAGYPSAVSDSFTGYSFLTHGDCACEYCYAFFQNRSFRSMSWVASSEGVSFMKLKEMRPHLLNPPEPPFYFYLTDSRQRQGWLPAMRCISHSRERFYVVTDWVGHFLVERSEVVRLSEVISNLREKQVSKTALRTGEMSMKQTREALEAGWFEEFAEVQKYKKYPLWEVLIAVAE